VFISHRLREALMRFLVAVALVVLSAADANEAPSVAGHWQGVVQIPGLPLHATIDLDQDKAGAWIGSIVVPELAIKNVALIDIAPHDSTLTFAIKGALAGPQEPPAMFEARCDSDDVISGTFTQAGNHAPFALRRTGAAQVDLSPRSTPVAKEMEGKWVGEYELMGYPRHVTVTFTNHGADPATVEWVIVGKKVNNLPVDFVQRDGDFVRIESHEFGINFEGRLHGGELDGTYEQGPMEAPLVLKRAQGEKP
jgi:hypothetical protein